MIKNSGFVAGLATGEPGSDNGVSMLKGAVTLAMQDEMRRQWLDAQMPRWRREAQAQRVEMITGRHRSVSHNCPGCGKPIKANPNRRREYCSLTCRVAHRRAKRGGSDAAA